MNSKKKGSFVISRYGQLTRQILLEYILALLALVALFIFLFILGWNFCQLFVWQADSLLYRVLSWMKEYVLLWGGLFIMCGWLMISYYFMGKPLRYLDDIVEAAGRLAQPDEAPILLTPVMKNVQDELNLARERGLRCNMAAKEAEQRKNDLIVYLAHDLKTPLTSVIGYLTLLRDEPEITPKLRERYTGIALEKAERLEELVNEFFDITRFNLSSLTLEPERVNLTRMVQQITFEFNPVLEEKELCWELALSPEVSAVCDPDKLERVFDNLLRNAVNYSYRGKAIRVELENEGDDIILRVKNSGKTIPPEKLSRIFEQFFRLDASRSTSTGGAGLGLAIAKEIVELHGGTITAECEGENITFTVRLPEECQKKV